VIEIAANDMITATQVNQTLFTSQRIALRKPAIKAPEGTGSCVKHDGIERELTAALPVPR
jgi:hypothetical protein